jgi:hypothetical protein
MSCFECSPIERYCILPACAILWPNLTVFLQGLANHERRRAVTLRSVGECQIMETVIEEAVR